MSDNINTIESQFEDIRKKFTAAGDRAFRKAGIRVGDDIVNGAPVVTGRLRANWQATIGSPAFGVVDKSVNPYEQIEGAAKDLKMNQVFHLTNNMPYAHFIEYGDYQGQHRQGVVRASTLNFKQDFIRYFGDELKKAGK